FMKKRNIDKKLIFGGILAYFLIYVTFDHIKVFWYLYTATMLFLISYTIVYEKIDDELPPRKYLIFGILSGAALYFVFLGGNWLLSYIPGDFQKEVAHIYKTLQLEWAWHYLVLVFIIIPGEE